MKSGETVQRYGINLARVRNNMKWLLTILFLTGCSKDIEKLLAKYRPVPLAVGQCFQLANQRDSVYKVLKIGTHSVLTSKTEIDGDKSKTLFPNDEIEDRTMFDCDLVDDLFKDEPLEKGTK
jgi:hypothetical protein